MIADLLAEGNRRVRGPLIALDALRVVFADKVSGQNAFANINTSDDLKALDAALSEQL